MRIQSCWSHKLNILDQVLVDSNSLAGLNDAFQLENVDVLRFAVCIISYPLVFLELILSCFADTPMYKIDDVSFPFRLFLKDILLWPLTLCPVAPMLCFNVAIECSRRKTADALI